MYILQEKKKLLNNELIFFLPVISIFFYLPEINSA